MCSSVKLLSPVMIMPKLWNTGAANLYSNYTQWNSKHNSSNNSLALRGEGRCSDPFMQIGHYHTFLRCWTGLHERVVNENINQKLCWLNGQFKLINWKGKSWEGQHWLFSSKQLAGEENEVAQIRQCFLVSADAVCKILSLKRWGKTVGML